MCELMCQCVRVRVCEFNGHKLTPSSFHTYGSFPYGRDSSITSSIGVVGEQRSVRGSETKGAETQAGREYWGQRQRQGGRQEDS